MTSVKKNYELRRSCIRATRITAEEKKETFDQKFPAFYNLWEPFPDRTRGTKRQSRYQFLFQVNNLTLERRTGTRLLVLHYQFIQHSPLSFPRRIVRWFLTSPKLPTNTTTITRKRHSSFTLDPGALPFRLRNTPGSERRIFLAGCIKRAFKVSLAVSQRGGARTATKSSSFPLITIQARAANVLSGISFSTFRPPVPRRIFSSRLRFTSLGGVGPRAEPFWPQSESFPVPFV